jgi:PDZ domain
MKLKIALIGLLFGAALVTAQEPASRPASDAVKTQIKNLDNDSFDVRTKAMDELRAAGESARTDLEAATKSQSLEVRSRAETLLKELDEKKTGAGAVRGGGLRPVTPDEEARGRQTIRGGTLPRPEDFPDPNAYAEAIKKWMEERTKTQRFPGWVLPDGKELEKDFTIITPGMGSGSFSFSQFKDGEKMTYKSGADGVTMEIEKKDENGNPRKETYTAKSADEFKANHPDLWEKYNPGEMGGLGWRGGGGFGQIERLAPIAPMPPIRATPSLTPPPGLNQPRLGVLTSAVPPVLDKQLKLRGEGVVIDTVYPDSLASRLGIQEHDVLLSFDGQVIRDRDDILRVLTQKEPPATATAKVVREGAVIELSAARVLKAK